VADYPDAGEICHDFKRQGRLKKIVRKDNFGNVTKEHEKIVIRQFLKSGTLAKKYFY